MFLFPTIVSNDIIGVLFVEINSENLSFLTL
jgi:hypothetical protein